MGLFWPLAGPIGVSLGLRVLDAWLNEGEAGDGDFGAHVLRLATTGGLARAGRYLLDVPALTQPYACDSSECTPLRRAPRTRSCCADVSVSLSLRERRALERAMPRLTLYMARRDARWREAQEVSSNREMQTRNKPIDADGVLSRPGGRCVFAVEQARGLRCGLQLAERSWGRAPGTLKPLPCRLFPIIVVDMGEGQRLLTAVARRTASLVGTYPAARFPCLRNDARRRPLYREMAATLRSVFGAPAARDITRALRVRAPG